MESVGVSILTNGRRRGFLERCVNTFLEYTDCRPLVIAVFDNGSQDDTKDWIRQPQNYDGVEWRWESVDKDLGVGMGTNRAMRLVEDCQYALHIESDFELLSPRETGVSVDWLDRGLRLMRSGRCDYLYLRRMMGHKEMQDHWWSQWMSKITEEEDGFVSCPGFWWSNNPALRDNFGLKNQGVIPLPEVDGEYKGSKVWCKSEFSARRPEKPWLMKWGVFVHERDTHKDFDTRVGCGQFGPYGFSTCKYGFFQSGVDRFCQACDWSKGIEDMAKHEKRFVEGKTFKDV